MKDSIQIPECEKFVNKIEDLNLMDEYDMIKLIERLDKTYYDKHNIKEHLKIKEYGEKHDEDTCRNCYIAECEEEGHGNRSIISSSDKEGKRINLKT
eukprot:UN23171